MKPNYSNMPSGKRITLFSVLLLLLATLMLLQAHNPDTQISDQSPSATELDLGDADYFTVLGPAVIEHNPAPGEVAYCPLDTHDRATCAYGSLTPQVREDAQRRGRQNINVDPSGWPSNTEVQIDALTDVEGSQSYSGWLWNRSHLLADSLGGDAVRENLVTGTRTQNVGSTQTGGQYSGGMAYPELTARDWLDAQPDESCPLYYAATPVYEGGELIPRTVLVDVQSCDQEVDMRVEVTNTANGWSIDYTNGSYEKE